MADKYISFGDLYNSKGLPVKVKSVNLWQDDAANALKFFTDSFGKEGSIFKCFRDNQQTARIALSDCKELGKHSIYYFLKVYSELNKKRK